MSFQIKAEPMRSTEAKRFRKGGRQHRLVRLHLEPTPGSDSNLDDVLSVEYELHPTFKQRYRLVEDPTGGFELKLWTYGYFPVRGRIRMKDGTRDECEGFVRW